MSRNELTSDVVMKDLSLNEQSQKRKRILLDFSNESYETLVESNGALQVFLNNWLTNAISEIKEDTVIVIDSNLNPFIEVYVKKYICKSKQLACLRNFFKIKILCINY